MITSGEIQWVSGLLEGEGCFSFSWGPGIYLTMTDHDVVEKVAKLWNKKVLGPYKYRAQDTPTYRVVLQGQRAIEWMMTIYSLMGERRKEAIRDNIARWKLMPGRGWRGPHIKKELPHASS